MFKYNSNKKRDIFFSPQRHVGTSCARSDFLFHKKSVTRSTFPPFPQKVPLRLRRSLVNALATLRLATNFLRVQVYFKIFCRHLFCLPLYTSEQGPLCSDLFFCLWLQNTPSAIPFLLLSARTHAQFTRSVSSALATVSLSLPTFRGFESISKLFANIFLVTSLQNDTEPIASGFNIIFYSYGGLELRYRFATSLR